MDGTAIAIAGGTGKERSGTCICTDEEDAMEGIALRMARGGSSITVGSPEMSPTAADGHDAPGVESTAAREAGAGASKTDESADTPSGIELREADDRQMWLER